MLCTEVVALELPGHTVIVGVVGSLGIYRCVAEGVASHICPDICLIMVQVYRSGMMIVRREVIPVPDGPPGMVVAYPEMDKDRRSCVECGPDHV